MSEKECKHSYSAAKLVIFNGIIIMLIWNIQPKILYLVQIVYNYVSKYVRHNFHPAPGTASRRNTHAALPAHRRSFHNPY